MKNGRKLALAMTHSSNCLVSKSFSTEDFWNEDAYIPEQYMLSSPGVKVSLSTVHQQPHISNLMLARPSLNSIPNAAEPGEQDYLLDPPQQYQSPPSRDSGGDRSSEDSLTFNNIISSLQGLADSLSADFDVSQENLSPNTILSIP